MSLLTTVFCETEQRAYNLYDNQSRTVCPIDALHLVYPDKCFVVSEFDTYGGIFGIAEDGDMIVSRGSTLTLSRDAHYILLTVSGTLNTNGYRLFVSDTLYISDTGILHNNGNDAVASVGGAATNTLGTVGYGSAGGNGTNKNGGSGAGLPAGTRLGGLGSAGETGSRGTAGLSGTGTVVLASNGGLGAPRVAELAVSGRDYSSTKFNGGSGGGASSAGNGNNGALSASGGVVKVDGGGGGGGGGIVLISARFVNCDVGGKISARGGNGANISGGPSGGGGGGGAIILITTSNPLANVSYDVSAGSGSNITNEFGVIYYLPV